MYSGQLVVSMFATEDSSDFYRAKIIRIESDFVEVYFFQINFKHFLKLFKLLMLFQKKIIYIDYGNTENKSFDQIYEMSTELKQIPSKVNGFHSLL